MNGNPSAGIIFTGTVDFGPLAVLGLDLHNASLQPSDPFYYPADGTRRAVMNLASANVFGLPDEISLVDAIVFSENYNGTVTITSTDPNVAPNINLDMFSDDVTGLVNGSSLNKLMAAFYNSKVVIDALGDGLIAPPAEVFNNPTDLANFIKETSTMQMHQVGTCRFGTSQANAVVDSNFNVFGIKNLKICDLSIFPYTVDGNPMFSVLTAASKAVEAILEGK